MANKLGILSSKPEPVEAIKAELLHAETALTAARTRVAEIKEKHAPDLARLVADDDQKTLKARREELGEAEEKVMLWQQKVDAFALSLKKAETEKASKELEHQWAGARDLIKRREKAIKRVQDAADEFADATAEAVDLSERVMAALPQRPNFQIGIYSKRIYGAISNYLFGASDGKLGASGFVAFQAKQQPSLVAQDADAQKILLQPVIAKAA